MHRAVIIGAGFGGLSAARTLAGADVEVTLVDQRNFHTFLPLLYEVATAGLDPVDIAYPVRATVGHAPNVRFRLGTVSAIDTDRREVCFADRDSAHVPGSRRCEDDLPFDSLVIATGVVANFFGVPGAAEYALPLYTLADARYLRDHILLRLEEADQQPEPVSDGTLTFAIVGGGPTGVEVAGAIAELLDMSVRRDGYRFDRSAARIVLVDGMDHVLTPFKDSAQRYAQRTLEDRTVELRLGQFVAQVTPDSIELADGTVVPTRTVIWAGGVTVDGTVASTFESRATRSGQLIVDSNLEVEGHPGVFAVGDAASIPLAPGSEERCPQLAQVAIQSGRHAAKQIRARAAGNPMTPFRYRDKGIMATIGRRAAIAQLRGGLVLRGTVGWLAWFGLHLLYLIGFRNKLTVLINWSWRYLNWPSGPRVIIGGNPDEGPKPDRGGRPGADGP
jgi:NADH:ubiquinone reductase (H+-translocating)